MPAAHRSLARALALVLAALCAAPAARAAAPAPGPPLAIHRASGPIVLDGDLSEAGWQGIEPITTWFETRIGDSVEPQVGNAAYLAYDDKYLYAAFRFDDPHPELIRAPIGDHDALSGNTDYGGVIVDSRDDGRTAQMFLANPHGLQYDAFTSDASGEDSSPDYFWDAAGKITPTGWNLELRIPFSSLRYSNAAEPTWGVLLYRNYPRERRYQFFTARLPRDVNCFICNSSKLTGLANLPHGSHLVVAPFATAQRSDAPSAGLGSPLGDHESKSDAGLDLKWSPLAGTAVDATLNPDFSQIESDAAQIVANERFALSFPEKRTFFLEGVDLFSAPFSAVYTRSITAPDGGVRTTGRAGSISYTALYARDAGGGAVILPGPLGSGDAPQDFRSDVGIVRVRKDVGRSFVSALVTAREIASGGHNRVFGPDFQWRPRKPDSFTGQALWSDTRTPNRPTLATEWDGRRLQDRALFLGWSHSTPHVDWYIQGMDLGPDFRADDGFITQVGYRELYVEPGYTWRPQKSFFNRIRLFTSNFQDETQGGTLLFRRVSLGSGADGRWSSFTRFELDRDDILVGSTVFQRFRPRLHLECTPGRLINGFVADAYLGDEIDFDNARKGSGATLTGSITVRPGDHLELRGDNSARWLHVRAGGGREGRLFAATIERLRATYSFNARSFVRLIGQYVLTTRDTSLYTFTAKPRTADLSASALFAYKLNWQTVLYAGYGDQRTYAPVEGRMEKLGRQLFTKISYAWQQ